MRKSITLISIILLVSVSLFGQNLKKLHPAFSKNIDYAEALTLNSLSAESNMLKSSQTTKQSLDSVIYCGWCEPEKRWEKRGKEEASFSAAGNLTHSSYSDWDEDSESWVNSWKEEYSYDTNNNLTLELFYEWNWKTEKWMNKEKHEYTYNAVGNITNKHLYGWDYASKEWIYWDEIEYTYNTNNKLSHTLERVWNKSTGKWEPRKQHFYTYNTDGNLTVDSLSWWYNSSNAWSASNKIEYAYNEDLMTEKSNYIWDNESNRWTVYHKSTYIYDSNDNVSQSFEYTNWNEDTQQWGGKASIEYTHNNSYVHNDILLPYYFNDVNRNLNNHMLTQILRYGFDEDLKSWTKSYNTEFYYSERTATEITKTKVGDNVLYPNPVKDVLHFRCTDNNQSATIELFDINGKIVLSKNIRNNESFNISSLNSGFYIYKITGGSDNMTGKLIKR